MISRSKAYLVFLALFFFSAFVPAVAVLVVAALAAAVAMRYFDSG